MGGGDTAAVHILIYTNVYSIVTKPLRVRPICGENDRQES